MSTSFAVHCADLSQASGILEHMFDDGRCQQESAGGAVVAGHGEAGEAGEADLDGLSDGQLLTLASSVIEHVFEYARRL